MNRNIIPILLVSIVLLIGVLIIIVVILLSAPERREAANMRGEAVRTLLGRSDSDKNLTQIAEYLSTPTETGGSISNLMHFLDKDPGRRTFSRNSDRRRAEAYFAGEAGEAITAFTNVYAGIDGPFWAPEFTAAVRTLFEIATKDVLVLSGVPSELTMLDVSEPGDSVSDRVVTAVTNFAENWIPSGETTLTYPEPDKMQVREHLLGSRRFGRRLDSLDEAWRELIASLYNLSLHPSWRVAVRYEPELAVQLEELTILALMADLRARNRDMMELVAGDGPGILITPKLSYYKNVPELNGLSSDRTETFYFAKVNIGYMFRDGRTQTWLNRRKDWLSDYFSTFFSNRTSEDFSPSTRENQRLTDWKLARLKAEGMHGINRSISVSMPLGKKKVYGVRDIALVRVNLLANP